MSLRTDRKIIESIACWYYPYGYGGVTGWVAYPEELCPLCKNIIGRKLWEHCRDKRHIFKKYTENPEYVFTRMAITGNSQAVIAIGNAIPISEAPMYINHRLLAVCESAKMILKG